MRLSLQARYATSSLYWATPAEVPAASLSRITAVAFTRHPHRVRMFLTIVKQGHGLSVQLDVIEHHAAGTGLRRSLSNSFQRDSAESGF